MRTGDGVFSVWLEGLRGDGSRRRGVPTDSPCKLQQGSWREQLAVRLCRLARFDAGPRAVCGCSNLLLS